MEHDDDGLRPSSYLYKFATPFLEWQPENISQHLALAAGGDIDDDQAFMNGGRLVVSQTSLYSFKCAFANEAFYPGNRYMFEVLFRKGQNFKIGICEESCLREPDSAFSDTTRGFAYYSNGQLRHGSKGSGSFYGEPFRANDVVTCYVDLVEGVLFFAKNGEIYGDAFK